MSLCIDKSKCSGCGSCVDVCSSGAIILEIDGAVINHEFCTHCELCVSACPAGAIYVEEDTRLISPQIKLISSGEKLALPTERPTHAPWLGSALVFFKQEILPYLARFAINELERRLASPVSNSGDVVRDSTAIYVNIPRRIRRRRRGGF
jgi:ferredoxin